jgi:hypothetical protein
MATDTSATLREEESHIIDASLKRRARLLMTKGSIPRQTRSLIQYALERRDRIWVRWFVVSTRANRLSIT